MVRFEQPASCCHDDLVSYWLQPLPVPAHTVSVQPRGVVSATSLVPPTATTFGDAAGQLGPYPLSPALAVIVTLAGSEASHVASELDSPAPQLLEIASAPRRAAVASAAIR